MKNMNEKGITLTTLIITVIILLILATVGISTLGPNGFVAKAEEAKKQAQIDEEKEIVGASAVQSAGANRYGNIEKEELEIYLDKNAGEGKTVVLTDGDDLVVKFIESERYYKVDTEGDIEQTEVIIDENPGDITVGINGEELNGTADKPYEIWCIEDLVAFSKAINNNEISRGCYTKLMRTLDFKSELSYTDYNAKYSYDETLAAYIKDESLETTLMELCTENLGFIPIGKSGAVFQGKFDGQGYEIQNLYINTTTLAGLFGATGWCTVQNLGISGNITSTEKSAGGIAGDGVDSKLINCYNHASIKGQQYAGGIIGHGSWGAATMRNCYNTGKITSGNCGGGLAGDCAGEVTDCYNLGDVSGQNAGGITGSASRKIIGNKLLQ